MNAKSIKGDSITAIHTALQQSLADGYQPTLAFVFLTEQKDIDEVTHIMDKAGIAVFGASTSEKFNEEGIEPTGILALLLDMDPANFRVVLKDFQSAPAYETACEVGASGKETFENPAFHR